MTATGAISAEVIVANDIIGPIHSVASANVIRLDPEVVPEGPIVLDYKVRHRRPTPRNEGYPRRSGPTVAFNNIVRDVDVMHTGLAGIRQQADATRLVASHLVTGDLVAVTVDDDTFAAMRCTKIKAGLGDDIVRDS